MKPPPDEAARQAYLARTRARLLAERNNEPPPPDNSVQPSPSSESSRPYDAHVELAGLASALSTVAERLAEVARALRGEP